MKGFIQIHRQLLNWEWYSDIPVRLTFIHLLLIANWEDKNWKGTLIERGQIIIGRMKLSKEIGISEQQLRTSFKKLKSTQEITIKSTNRFSVVSILKYNDYQIKLTNKKTIKQPTNNQQATTTKEYNNIIIKNINNRLAEFKNSLHKFKDDYNSNTLNEFYLYWTEKKPKGKKMLFEMQKTFDISRRLARWDKNNFNKTPKKEKKDAAQILQERYNLK